MNIKRMFQLSVLVLGIGIAVQTECAPIFIRTASGYTYTIDVDSSDTVAEIRRKLNEKDPDLQDNFRLIFAGKRLEGDWTVGELGLFQEGPIHLIKSTPLSLKVA